MKKLVFLIHRLDFQSQSGIANFPNYPVCLSNSFCVLFFSRKIMPQHLMDPAVVSHQANEVLGLYLLTLHIPITNKNVKKNPFKRKSSQPVNCANVLVCLRSLTLFTLLFMFFIPALLYYEFSCHSEEFSGFRIFMSLNSLTLMPVK